MQSTPLYMLPNSSPQQPLLLPSLLPASSVKEESGNNEPLNIKAFCGKEIRRFALTGPISWQSLLREAAVVFQTDPQLITIKYEDEDEDLITLSSDAELAHFLRILSPDGHPSLVRIHVEKRTPDAIPPPSGMITAPSAPHASAFGGPAWPPMSNPFEQAPPVPGSFSPAPMQFQQAPPEIAMGEARAAPPFHPSHVAPPPGFENVEPMAGLSKKELKKAWKQQIKAGKHPEKERRRAMKEARKHELRLAKQQKREAMMAWREQRRSECLARKAKPLHARFVKHLSIEDGTEMSPNTPFTKTWRMRNDGTLPWPADTALYYVSQRAGDQMGSAEVTPLTAQVNAGETVDVSVQLISPSEPGLYGGFWKLCGTHKGKTRKFGQQIWCKIQVLSLSDDEKKRARPGVVEEKEMRDAPEEESVSMASLLKQLKEMGFEDTGKNIALIKYYQGDMGRVVDTLSMERSSSGQFGAFSFK